MLLITPTPLGMDHQNKPYENGKVKRIRVAERTRAYNSVVRDHANANGLLLCDAEKLLEEEAKLHKDGLASLTEDGKRLKTVHA